MIHRFSLAVAAVENVAPNIKTHPQPSCPDVVVYDNELSDCAVPDMPRFSHAGVRSRFWADRDFKDDVSFIRGSYGPDPPPFPLYRRPRTLLS